MACNNTELSYEWLLAGVTDWMASAGSSRGYSIKSTGSSRVYITCPHNTTDTIYMEIRDGSVVLWSDAPSIQTTLQTSEILDRLDDSNLAIQNTLNAFATALSKGITSIIDTIIIDDDSNGENNNNDNGNNNDDDDDDDSADMDDADYYADMDEDLEPPIAVKEKSKEELEDDKITADQFFTGDGSFMAVQRLLLDLKNLTKIGDRYGFEGSPRGDNLFIWDVRLKGFEKDTKLFKDLKEWSKKTKFETCIYMEMKFPKDYPMSPPFVRLLRPKFKFLTGHVTIGGSVCMQVLTRTGWQPTNDIESVLVQIRAQIMADPNASLNLADSTDYSEQEAISAFQRMCARYGWKP